ncbi:MAG: MFS transporter [Acetobacteraceae bacterium]|nr:MFS transporter [Acetobacteraceae bacterium]
MQFPDGLPAAPRLRAMFTLTLAVGLSVLGASLPNIALPSIAAELRVSPAASVWVVNAYQIAVTVTLLPFSSLGDIYGYRRVYGWGIVVFTIGSLLCALAPDLQFLVAARILQGLGAAGIMSVNSALVRTIFPRALLGRGMGLNTMVVATSLALGPTTSAGILALGDWHWLFLVNVPLGVVAMATLHFLPRTARGAHRFDVASALLNAAALGLFIAGLDRFGHGGFMLAGIALLAMAGAAGFVFVKRQMTLSAPMLPVDLFRRPVFALAVATSVCSYMGQTCAYVALPFLFHAGGASEIGTGLLMTPWPVAVMAISPFAGVLSDRFSAGLLGGVGLALMTAGLLAIAALAPGAAWWDVAWRMVITGAGFALFQTPNNRQLISAVPRERSGAGSGMISTSRLLGQTMGAAVVALVFAALQARGMATAAAASVLVGAGLVGVAAVLSLARLKG